MTNSAVCILPPGFSSIIALCLFQELDIILFMFFYVCPMGKCMLDVSRTSENKTTSAITD